MPNPPIHGETLADRVNARPFDNELVLPPTGFVRQRLLLRFVPFSKSKLWRRVKAGDFPAPVRLSAGVTAWRAEEVHR
jgi:predicted DNA-binding transcriptional regulator AlpA